MVAVEDEPMLEELLFDPLLALLALGVWVAEALAALGVCVVEAAAALGVCVAEAAAELLEEPVLDVPLPVWFTITP